MNFPEMGSFGTELIAPSAHESGSIIGGGQEYVDPGCLTLRLFGGAAPRSGCCTPHRGGPDRYHAGFS